MDSMHVFSGGSFKPLKPNKEDIHIQDIAHALSLICRGNGHLLHFYSVAQHCVNCVIEAKARGFSERVQLACLLHDASEAYIADIIRPVKKYFSQYHEIESHLQGVIYEKYIPQALSAEELQFVKEIDDCILKWELRYLFAGNENALHIPMNAKLEYQYKRFQDVEKQFLDIFEQLMKS